MRASTVAAGTAMILLLGACSDGLRFRTDHRLRFLHPPERSLVDGPVVVRWSVDARRFRPVGPDGTSDDRRGFFGVFVDRPPMRPGEGVDALARDDAYCRREVGCPDRDWLRRHGVHLTTRLHAALPPLRSDAGQDLGGRRRHEVTIVLLDGRGLRIGESSWSLTLFTQDRRP